MSEHISDPAGKHRMSLLCSKFVIKETIMMPSDVNLMFLLSMLSIMLSDCQSSREIKLCNKRKQKMQ